MKGVFQAGGVTFAIDSKNISEVIQCEKISPLIASDERVIGTVTIRNVAVPIINISKMKLLEKPLILVIENNDSEIGVIIESVLGLYDFESLKKSTCRNTGLGEHLYYSETIGENIISLTVEEFFTDKGLPSIRKRQFDTAVDSAAIEDSTSFLVMQACKKLIAIDTKYVATTLVDFEIEGTTSSECYIGETYFNGNKIPCLDFGVLTKINDKKSCNKVLLVLRVRENLVGVLAEKIFDVTKLTNKRVKNFPNIGVKDNWFSGLIVGNEKLTFTKEESDTIYVLNTNLLKTNKELISASMLFSNEAKDDIQDKNKLSSVIIAFDKGEDLSKEYYAIPTSQICEIFTSYLEKIDIPKCGLINGLTVFNGEPYSAINTAKVLGIESRGSHNQNSAGKFLTISNEGEKYAFQVDELIDVSIVELIKSRPDAPSTHKKCKEDNFYCQPVSTIINDKKTIINIVYMKDIVKKIMIENELESNCEVDFE